MPSLVTRCPACATLFKVVPDQLRISEGWVRCGQCDEVFDANTHMQPPMELASDLTEPRGTPATDNSAVAAMVDVRQRETSPSIVSPQAAEHDVSPEQATQPDSEEVPAALPEAVPLSAMPTPTADTPSHADAGEWSEQSGLKLLVTESPPLQRASTPPAPADEVPEDSEGEPESVPHSFLKTVPQPVTNRRWRWSGGVVVIVLMALLLMQVMVHERDRIAATEPAATPLLQALCAAWNCDIQPLRQIESIVIESSSFVKVKADVYRLSFTVKNTALVPLALPSAELALTDLRDQSVLRRVLSPAEYGAQAPTLAAGEELALVVPVAVKANAQIGDKVTGYRLLVFYP